MPYCLCFYQGIRVATKGFLSTDPVPQGLPWTTSHLDLHLRSLSESKMPEMRPTRSIYGESETQWHVTSGLMEDCWGRDRSCAVKGKRWGSYQFPSLVLEEVTHSLKQHHYLCCWGRPWIVDWGCTEPQLNLAIPKKEKKNSWSSAHYEIIYLKVIAVPYLLHIRDKVIGAGRRGNAFSRTDAYFSFHQESQCFKASNNTQERPCLHIIPADSLSGENSSRILQSMMDWMAVKLKYRYFPQMGGQKHSI